MMKNITNASGSSVVDVPKPKGGFLSRLNPIKRIKDSAKGLAKGFPSILKKVPVIGGVVEGIFLNSAINQVLEDPETSDDEKKQLVGAEFIKALTGPAGAAIAIGAVGALTGGTGFLASAVTGAAGYSIGKVVGGVLASVLPSKQIGGAIIDTFYKKKAIANDMNMDSSPKKIAAPKVSDDTQKIYNQISDASTKATSSLLAGEEIDPTIKANIIRGLARSDSKLSIRNATTDFESRLDAVKSGDMSKEEFDTYIKRSLISATEKAGKVSESDVKDLRSLYEYERLEQLNDKEKGPIESPIKAITADSKEKVESVTDSMKNVRTNSAEKQIKALKSFESDETKGEYTFAEIDGIGYRRKYKDPEAQKEYEKLLDDKFLYEDSNKTYEQRKAEDAEYYKQNYQQMIDSGADPRDYDVQDLKYRYLESMGYGEREGKNLERVDHERMYQNLFLQEKGMLPSEGSYTTGMAGDYNPDQMIHNLLMKKPASALAIDKSQLTKNMNTTGVDMLNQTSQISDIKSSQENKESAAPVIAADNSSRNNVVNTTINEAPNHIDRTMNLFGTPSVAY